jgi:acetyltransferase-like isoleucine patch superfamily enzyme
MFVKKLKRLSGKIKIFLTEDDYNENDVFTKNLVINKNVHIGDYTYGFPNVSIWTDRYHLYIGKFCSIAENVRILVDGNHRTDFITTYPLDHYMEGLPFNPNNYSLKGDVHIGNDVWIGQSALILPGVSIGNGAVIAAGSIVVKNVKDYEIVGGNPARHIRYRFTEEQITKLNEIKWWDWPIEKIIKNATILQSSNINDFFKIASDLN